MPGETTDQYLVKEPFALKSPGKINLSALGSEDMNQNIRIMNEVKPQSPGKNYNKNAGNLSPLGQFSAQAHDFERDGSPISPKNQTAGDLDFSNAIQGSYEDKKQNTKDL